MKHAISLALAGAVTLGATAWGGTAYADSADAARPARAAVGQVHIIQAVPDDTVTVTVDGKAVQSGAALGEVLGPFKLSPGTHTIGFRGSSGAMTSRLDVKAGTTNDVVLHRPAAVGGDPVISSYTTPMTAIGPNKSRVLIAHTATVAPADVRVDGKVVFTNIANGEYATADLASGKHSVALLPTGVDTNPILGPIDVTLEPRTVTMVYAVGDPNKKSMQVIAHVVTLRADGSVAPETIDTGSAGLAAGVPVRPFSSGAPDAGASGAPAGLIAVLLAALLAPAAVLLRRRVRRTARA